MMRLRLYPAIIRRRYHEWRYRRLYRKFTGLPMDFTQEF